MLTIPIKQYLNYYLSLAGKYFLVIAMAVNKPLNRAPPMPQLMISCPVKYRFLMGVVGRKKS